MEIYYTESNSFEYLQKDFKTITDSKKIWSYTIDNGRLMETSGLSYIKAWFSSWFDYSGEKRKNSLKTALVVHFCETGNGTKEFIQSHKGTEGLVKLYSYLEIFQSIKKVHSSTLLGNPSKASALKAAIEDSINQIEKDLGYDLEIHQILEKFIQTSRSQITGISVNEDVVNIQNNFNAAISRKHDHYPTMPTPFVNDRIRDFHYSIDKEAGPNAGPRSSKIIRQEVLQGTGNSPRALKEQNKLLEKASNFIDQKLGPSNQEWKDAVALLTSQIPLKGASMIEQTLIRRGALTTFNPEQIIADYKQSGITLKHSRANDNTAVKIIKDPEGKVQKVRVSANTESVLTITKDNKPYVFATTLKSPEYLLTKDGVDDQGMQKWKITTINDF